ncbi:MAG: tRNA uridine-5-carboxymethylaminomethyl(34) synthesis GTPase MnmE, partial [Oscillospiraceae bacterium]
MAKTIAAIATPLAVGGISVIRISGDDAISTAEKVFKPASGVLLSQKPGYTASFGHVYNGNTIIDTSVAVVFRAPKSYTGEDVVEISCHGGVFITREVLRIITQSGAVLALPGEFSKRAFINGKLSLTQAEAVIDVINSQNSQALKAAQSQLDGALYKNIISIKDQMITIAGHLTAWIDFPEEDVPEIENAKLLSSLINAQQELEKLLQTFDVGQIIKNGVLTAIVGKPNVGKSTLMNRLSGYDKSIVTKIPGTTRDVVEETINLGDVVLNLCDTAGIHKTEDIVEQFGVQKSYEKIKSASLILAVFDNSLPLTEEDKLIINAIGDTLAIAVLNKSDLPNKIDTEYIKAAFKHIVYISAQKDENVQCLNDMICNILNISDIDLSSGMIATERQRAAALSAKGYIDESILALKSSVTLDAITVLIELAIDALLELTGERV